MENVMLLLIALVITILVEIAVLMLMGEKRRKVIIASVVIEALWYCLFVGKVSQAAVYSVLCNAVSFLTGVIIFGIDNNLT